MNCIIIEDLQVAADYLARCCQKSGAVEVLGHFPDVDQALAFLNKTQVDLLFLDVEMPGSTGFDLLDHLHYHPRVILTTSKEEYAYNAFQYHVADFLKKPFTYARFMEALAKVNGKTAVDVQAPPADDHIFIKSDGKLIRLNYKDILYIESVGNYVRFVTEGKKYLAPHTVKALEERISREHFMKVHRAFIINIHKIDDIRENDLFIRGTEIPISKALRSDVLKRLNIL